MPRGRPKGAKNKHTREREEAAAKAAERAAEVLGPTAFEGDAHALLIMVYKDAAQPIELRMDAAKASLAYEKPRLSAIEHSGTVDMNWTKASLEEIEQAIYDEYRDLGISDTKARALAAAASRGEDSAGAGEPRGKPH